MAGRYPTDHRFDGTLCAEKDGLRMRDHILETASRLFYEYGIRAVGVDRVIAEANIAKATLYRHFPSKDDLIVAYLETRSERALAALQAIVDKAGESPRMRIAALFEELQRTSDANEFKGCAFVLAVAEHQESESIRRVAMHHKDSVRMLIRDAIGQPGDSGDRIAEQLSLLYDGAMTSVLIYRNSYFIRNACFAALELLPPENDQVNDKV